MALFRYFSDNLDMPQTFSSEGGMQTVDRKVETEVILSPAAAKELLNWLGSHVRDYEKIFGTINTNNDAAMKYDKKVRTLYGSMNQNEISRTLDMSESLVKEYIAIHEEFNKKEEKVNDGSS